MLEFRMRMYLIGHHMRWVVLAVAAGVVTWGSPEERANAAIMYVMIALASFYNLALWVIPWQRFEEEGRGNLVAVPYILADTICIGIVVYATGGIESDMYIAYLLLVVWMSMYPGTRDHRWLWVIVVASYAVAAFLKDPVTGLTDEQTQEMIYSFVMRAAIFGFVAWLTYQISRELNVTYSKLESAVRDLTDGVVVLDDQDRVILMNPRAVALLGVPEAEALGRKISRGVASERFARLRKLAAAEDAAEMTTDGQSEIRTHEITIEGNRKRVVRVYSVPYRDDQGRHLGEMKVLHDVTNLKELDRLRAEWISALTHDLFNPLHTIKTIMRVFRGHTEKMIGDENERMLTSIEDHMERLIRLTREMLDSARIEAGTLELDMSPTVLSETVQSVVEALQWDAQAKSIELACSLDGELPPVNADGDRLIRVIYNIVENAVKFTPDGGSVRVSCRACPEDESMAEVSVCDTGPGIPPEKADMIFERFVRVGDEVALKTRGTGLGLPICRELVEAHNGRLWVESTPGEGSEFHFTVPFATGT